ncbi:MAG TPA: TolC family protein [Bacteroidales bacterium]|nr:TolC family protein [Bacteroidales bacterium]
MLVNIHVHKKALLLSIAIVLVLPLQAQIWTLQQCLDTAQVNNKNLQISKNNVLLGQQRNSEAKSNLMPKINALADYKYYTDLPYQLIPMSMFGGPEGQFKENQFGVPHTINLNLQFSMPLYNPQIYGAIAATKVASELTQLQYKQTEEQVFFEVSNLYYNAQIVQYQLLYSDSNLINTKKLLANMQLLKDQQMVKTTDVSKISLQAEQLTTQKELLQAKYEQILSLLKFSIGIEQSKPLEIEPKITYIQTNEYQSNQPVESKIAGTRTKLLANELRTLKFSRLPSLSLYGTYGQTGYGYTEEPNEFLNFYPLGFVGVQFSYPLFNGTSTQKKINQKKIEVQTGQLQQNLIAEQNAMQIENAKRQKNIAQRNVAITLLQIELAQTVYKQTVLQQQEGTAGLTEVLLADNALREAQQTHLSVIIEYLKTDLELKKITGNLTSKNF